APGWMPPAAHFAFCFRTASLPIASSCLRTCSRATVVALTGAGADLAPSVRCVVGVPDVGRFATVPGGDLADWARLLRRGPGAWLLRGVRAERGVKAVAAALRQLAGAVGSFHRLSPPIVHRDLKPSNVLLDRANRRLRVTDFGIGSVTARATLEAEAAGTGTRGGRLLSYLRGSHTPLYASPQQRAGADPDPRDDVHALGVIGYQLLTGHLDQGAGPDFADDLRKHGAPGGLIALPGRCVAQKPDRRPKDANDLAAELVRLQDSAELAPPPPAISGPLPPAPLPGPAPRPPARPATPGESTAPYPFPDIPMSA